MTSRFWGAGGNGLAAGFPANALIPIAISYFKNGVYSIGGVSKTYAEMWEAPVVLGANVLAVVADVGFRNTYVGTTTSAAGYIHGQPELFSAVADPVLGHSGVISVSIVGDAADPAFRIGLYQNVPPFHNIIALAFKSINGVRATSFAPTVNSATATPLYVDGTLNRVAYTITPTVVSASINGSAVVSAAVQPVITDLPKLWHHSDVSVAPTGATMITERIDFYRPLTDAQLMALSA